MAKQNRPKKRPYKYKHSHLARKWRRYGYKHTTAAVLSIVLFVLLLDTAIIQALLSNITALGFGGIFLSGILFVSFFTAAPALAVLVAAADIYDPLTIAVIAGVGSVIGDLIILKVFEEKIGYELKPLSKKFGLRPVIRAMHRKAFRPVALVLGSFIIASPLPDEAGIALLGLSHISLIRLLGLTFVLNTGGILVLVLATKTIVAA